MSVLNMIVTDAGRALLAGGTVNIDKVAIGSGTWAPTAAATALNAQIKQITAIEGIAAAADMIHITATDSTSDVYTVREIGLYSGATLFAIYAQASPIVSKIADSIALIATDVKFTSVTPGSVTVGAANFGYPQATETQIGVAEIATQAEADAETDDARFITPKKLAARLKKAVPIGALLMWPSQTLPDGFLERNGAALSRTTYAALFAIIGTTYGAGDGSTTFNLPDDRGLFERGWDHGRGYDSGRGFGSEQGHEFASHTHTVTVNSADAWHQHSGATVGAGDHAHLSATFQGGGGGANDYPWGGENIGLKYYGGHPDGSVNPTPYTNTTGNHAHNFATDWTNPAHAHTASNSFTGGAETRPRNRAYLPIIRAY